MSVSRQHDQDNTRNRIPPPETDMHPSKTARACPSGAVPRNRSHTPPSRPMQFICQCIIAQVYRAIKTGHTHHPLAPCNSFVSVQLHRYPGRPKHATHINLSLHATHLSVYDCTCKPGDQIGHTRHPLAPCNSLSMHDCTGISGDQNRSRTPPSCP